MVNVTKKELIAFEKEISELFLDKKIGVPIHLSGSKDFTQELQLIRIFKNIEKKDWVFSTHRNHFHALLKGIPKEKLKKIITDGESMHIYDKKRKFFSSSIVGGILPIALGVAISIKKSGENSNVWVFVGDMCNFMGMFHEVTTYASRNDLPITFVVEDNGVSCDSPTQIVWGESKSKPHIIRYNYTRVWPHTGVGKWVSF
ncbi:MAG: hypothetical protein IMZ52_07940 [Actinobacteria bacterium]|nr:hypothetical protein [Actinomycetota bacterium]MBE3114655.1 hypothetical protein [Actinomycetota bacterium]